MRHDRPGECNALLLSTAEIGDWPVFKAVQLYQRTAAGDSPVEPPDAFIAKIVEKTSEASPIPCTRCNYCLPCPNGVNIHWRLADPGDLFTGAR